MKWTRNWPAARLVCALLATIAAAGGATAQSASAPAAADPRSSASQCASPAQAVGSIGITVGDLAREANFFTDVLNFERVGVATEPSSALSRTTGLENARAKTARLRLGSELIELTEYESPRGVAFPPDSRGNDRWFQHIAIVVSDMERAHARVHEKMVRHASKDPQRLPDWNKNAAGIKAFYFRDPEGHFLELIEFPSDKGDPKWRRLAQADPNALFLGIDHTAIVVADTDASLAFYRDLLGLRVVGGSENYGPEQEALNNVPGAHLRITTLRADHGPGVELLQYLAPRDGRVFPADARPCDLIHWQTTLFVRSTDLTEKSLRTGGYSILSRNTARLQITETATASAGAAEAALLVRDPDGHAIRFLTAPDSDSDDHHK